MMKKTENKKENLEIVIFEVGGESYCINLLRIKEIIELERVTPIPKSGPEVLGITRIRDSIIPVMDLGYILTKERTKKENIKMALVCELDKGQTVFTVDVVSGIRRMSWEDVSPAQGFLKSNLLVGTIILDGKIILMVDLQGVVDKSRVADLDYPEIPARLPIKQPEAK